MNQEEVIQKVAKQVKSKLEGEGSGHDWWHINRVWNNAKHIAEKESESGKDLNMFHIELGALLHDIADYKFHGGDELIGGQVSEQLLKEFNVSKEDIEAVVHIVNNVSFKGELSENKMKSMDGKIVQDADRLDAMGAIGIARCFAYGGYKGGEFHNPDSKAHLNMTKEEYKTNKSTSINHFYEKLLLLKDLMNTKSGKAIAEGRHVYMEQFLEQFFAEWDCTL